MLKHFAARGSDYHMSIDQAQKFDQRPFRSMLIRGYIEFSPRNKGFHLTPAGRDAWEAYQHTNIARKNPTLPLTAYFDPSVYGLTVVHPKSKKEKSPRRGGLRVVA
jgi:hypothetical protein